MFTDTFNTTLLDEINKVLYSNRARVTYISPSMIQYRIDSYDILYVYNELVNVLGRDTLVVVQSLD